MDHLSDLVSESIEDAIEKLAARAVIGRRLRRVKEANPTLDKITEFLKTIPEQAMAHPEISVPLGGAGLGGLLGATVDKQNRLRGAATGAVSGGALGLIPAALQQIDKALPLAHDPNYVAPTQPTGLAKLVSDVQKFVGYHKDRPGNAYPVEQKAYDDANAHGYLYEGAAMAGRNPATGLMGAWLGRGLSRQNQVNDLSRVLSGTPSPTLPSKFAPEVAEQMKTFATWKTDPGARAAALDQYRGSQPSFGAARSGLAGLLDKLHLTGVASKVRPAEAMIDRAGASMLGPHPAGSSISRSDFGSMLESGRAVNAPKTRLGRVNRYMGGPKNILLMLAQLAAAQAADQLVVQPAEQKLLGK